LGGATRGLAHPITKSPTHPGQLFVQIPMKFPIPPPINIARGISESTKCSNARQLATVKQRGNKQLYLSTIITKKIIWSRFFRV